MESSKAGGMDKKMSEPGFTGLKDSQDSFNEASIMFQLINRPAFG
jgi:hypothetical protein